MLLGSAQLGHLTMMLASHATAVATQGLAARLPPPAPLRHPVELVWISVVSDSLVAAAYGVMLACLAYMGVRLKHVKGFQSSRWVVLWFGMLILACGASRVMSIIAVWWPIYTVTTLVRVLCAAAAIPAALLFAQATPALVKRIRQFVDLLLVTEQQRDNAVSALTAWEQLVEERQVAAQEIATAYGQLNSALECTSDMVFTLAQDWTVLYCNGKALSNIPDLKVHKNYWECFPDVLGTAVEANMRRTMESRESTRWENFYAPYARWFKVQAYPSEDGMSIFFSDVTEEHNIREQLELEQILREKRIEALSHMAGGLAHEISNPLAIIHAKASDLKDTAAVSAAPLPAAGVLETCTSIVSVSERAMGILRGLRGFARNAENDPMDWASIDQIVDQCVELQETRYERHGIALRATLAQELPLLFCREIQVGQIVTNLLNNAFDAIEQAGCQERWVELTARTNGAKLLLEVTDSGPGVEDQFKAHLMEPFFTTKKGGQGMGVGLSLSRAIAQDHGGQLTLVNETEHTCFRLVLPVVPEAAVHQAQQQEGASHATQ
jgi:C4-dicarboxylate-specific signal transduction histidine kinase